MSFSLTINADTFDEFKAKIIALEDMFAVETVEAPANPVMPELRGATAAQAAKPVKDKQAAKKPEPTAPEPETEAAVETTAAEETMETEAQNDLGVPDKATDPDGFKTWVSEHITPRVVKAVTKYGKPVVNDLLASYGVEKASLIAAEDMAEFIAKLDDDAALNNIKLRLERA